VVGLNARYTKKERAGFYHMAQSSSSSMHSIVATVGEPAYVQSVFALAERVSADVELAHPDQCSANRIPQHPQDVQ
jgi:hypothetical protein